VDYGAIHEHLPRIAKPDERLMGWTKARELEKWQGEKDRGSIVHPGALGHRVRGLLPGNNLCGFSGGGKPERDSSVGP